MAIIPCSACGKKISSLASICSHCGHQTGEVSEADRAILHLRKLRDEVYKLSMYSYAVITVFVIAFGWYWWDSSGFEQASSSGPYYLMGLSAVGYLLIRALLFRKKMERRRAPRPGD